jgi:hypothetical protein
VDVRLKWRDFYFKHREQGVQALLPRTLRAVGASAAEAKGLEGIHAVAALSSWLHCQGVVFGMCLSLATNQAAAAAIIAAVCCRWFCFLQSCSSWPPQGSRRLAVAALPTSSEPCQRQQTLQPKVL